MKRAIRRVQAHPLPKVVHEPLVDFFGERGGVGILVVVCDGLGLSGQVGDDAAELG
jgi:hypothetical protein